MKPRMTKLLLIAICAVVSACSPMEVKSDRDDKKGITRPLVGTRVAMLSADDCTVPSSRGVGVLFFALAKAVAPAVIDQGLSWIQKFFESQAAKYNATMSSQNAGLFYLVKKGNSGPEFNLAFACVAVAHGVLQSGDGSEDQDTEYPSALGLAGKPEVYFESRLDFHMEAGTPYLRLVPTSLEFNDPLASKGKVKDLVVTYSFTYLSGGKSTAVSYIVPTLENLVPGTVLEGPALDSLSTLWSPVPIPVIPENQLPLINAQLSEDDLNMMPVSVSVTLTETDQGRGAAIYNGLAAILEQSKGSISGVLNKTIEEL